MALRLKSWVSDGDGVNTKVMGSDEVSQTMPKWVFFRNYEQRPMLTQNHTFLPTGIKLGSMAFKTSQSYGKVVLTHKLTRLKSNST